MSIVAELGSIFCKHTIQKKFWRFNAGSNPWYRSGNRSLL